MDVASSSSMPKPLNLDRSFIFGIDVACRGGCELDTGTTNGGNGLTTGIAGGAVPAELTAWVMMVAINCANACTSMVGTEWDAWLPWAGMAGALGRPVGGPLWLPWLLRTPELVFAVPGIEPSHPVKFEICKIYTCYCVTCNQQTLDLRRDVARWMTRRHLHEVTRRLADLQAIKPNIA